MEPIAYANIVIISIICLCSYKAFTDRDFKDLFLFIPHRIIEHKEYYRIISSAFIHAGIPHLVFNCFSLYSFGSSIEFIYGSSYFLIIFFSSVIGGDLLSLIIHRNHAYSALGASGGVCGVIFSSIFLLPHGSVQMFFIPVPIPSSFYAILFLVISIYGIKSHYDNIGHDAHLGGAIIGLLVTTVLKPEIVKQSIYLYIIVLSISLMFFYYLYVTKGLNVPFIFTFYKDIYDYFSQIKRKKDHNLVEKHNKQVDDILLKISKEGMKSLTKRENEILTQASKKKRNKHNK